MRRRFHLCDSYAHHAGTLFTSTAQMEGLSLVPSAMFGSCVKTRGKTVIALCLSELREETLELRTPQNTLHLVFTMYQAWHHKPVGMTVHPLFAYICNIRVTLWSSSSMRIVRLRRMRVTVNVVRFGLGTQLCICFTNLGATFLFAPLLTARHDSRFHAQIYY